MTSLPERFWPFTDLAGRLLPHAVTDGHDAAHDASHVCRVWSLASRIATIEGGDAEVLAAATILHDCVAIPKTSPRRAEASRLAGAEALRLLRRLGWAESRIAMVVHAIEAHSFSAGIAPGTLEAMILQDADRLDAVGAIGVARCFMVAGRLGQSPYDVADPTAEGRALDDRRWALEHFASKLLKLRGTYRTGEGMRLGEIRHERVARAYADILDEIGWVPAFTPAPS